MRLQCYGKKDKRKFCCSQIVTGFGGRWKVFLFSKYVVVGIKRRGFLTQKSSEPSGGTA
jgi:hypothetical protein